MEGEEFDYDKIDQISKNLKPNHLQALGLPTSLSPINLILTLIKGIIPSIGKKLLGGIFNRLTGRGTGQPQTGFFNRLGRTIIRVIDAILGVIVGVIGGAIMGAGAIGFAGITGGLSGIALDPTTIRINSRDGDNWVIHGDEAHKRMNPYGNQGQPPYGYPVPPYPQPGPPNGQGGYNNNYNYYNNNPPQPDGKVRPSPSFLD